jgi:hypothetical protein
MYYLHYAAFTKGNHAITHNICIYIYIYIYITSLAVVMFNSYVVVYALRCFYYYAVNFMHCTNSWWFFQ